MNYKRLAIAILAPLGVVGWFAFWQVLFSTVVEPLPDTNSWGSTFLVGGIFTLFAAVVVGFTWFIVSETVIPWVTSCNCPSYHKGMSCKKYRAKQKEEEQKRKDVMRARYIRKLEEECGIVDKDERYEWH